MTVVLRCVSVGPIRLPQAPVPTMSQIRLPANGKYWLKRARIRFAPPPGEAPAFAAGAAADGTVLADVRIEDGRIRAVVPAGTAPCCSPGIDLDGGCARTLDGEGALATDGAADLELSPPGGTSLVLEAGVLRPIRTA